jgi:formimidoylglutamate deiminase
VAASLDFSGARPVEWLLDHAPVDEHWCLVHATHVNEREITGMAASRAVVGLCPTTEANLGDGIFPLAAYEAAGGRWAVGTDSHVGRNPATELRTLEYGQRLVRQERNVAGGRQHGSTGRALLELAWNAGADACGRRVGRLAMGYRADIVLLDPDHPSLVGRTEDEALDSWVFSGDATPVRHVFTGGRWMVRDGHHLLEDEVLGEYRAVARELARNTPQLGLDLGA